MDAGETIEGPMAMDDDLMYADYGELPPVDFLNLLLNEEDPHGAWQHSTQHDSAPCLIHLQIMAASALAQRAFLCALLHRTVRASNALLLCSMRATEAFSTR